MENNNYYITTAIAYTSGKPHIGNTYEVILADAIARFKRLQGYNVFYQTGTDEHGQKIEEKAKIANTTPKQFVDKVASQIKDICDLMNISYDKFIRTTDEDHKAQVQKMFKYFYDNGDIYKGSYEGNYCTPCESFWTNSQLKDGKCPDCGREVKKANEEAYFFRMSKYADRLIEHINNNKDFIQPVSRKNEMMNNFLLPGLQDLCVSRTSFKWGIPVDFDEGHVVYVWLDALSNYITGIGYNLGGESSEQFKSLWPCDLHVIGKDIIRFHTIYWPIFLMALGEKLPKAIYGHPWLLQEGGKMSKSVGNVIYADDLVEFYGVDAVRYYTLSSMPYDNDGCISWDLVTDKINSELANVYGNLVNRTIAMSNKYFNGVVENTNTDQELDIELKEMASGLYKKVATLMDQNKIADSISAIMTVLRRANKYIDETCPWILAKNVEDHPRLKTVLYNLTETLVITSTLLYPFIPSSAKNMLDQLNADLRKVDDLSTFGLYESGKRVTVSPTIVFARIDGVELNKKVKAMYEAKNNEKAKTEIKQPIDPLNEENNEEIEQMEEIGIEDFLKIQLLVGKVINAEYLKKSKKLIKLTVDVAGKERTILSGIREWYTAEELIGKSVVIVANLKPVKLCGEMSYGMVLCAEKNGKVVLVSPEQELPSGATVR